MSMLNAPTSPRYLACPGSHEPPRRPSAFGSLVWLTSGGWGVLEVRTTRPRASSTIDGQPCSLSAQFCCSRFTTIFFQSGRPKISYHSTHTTVGGTDWENHSSEITIIVRSPPPRYQPICTEPRGKGKCSKRKSTGPRQGGRRAGGRVVCGGGNTRTAKEVVNFSCRAQSTA